MGKRGLKKRAESLRLQILKHENKIKHEMAKQLPDEGKIHHWEAEIKAFKNNLLRVLKRLKNEDIDV
ncbi:MAG: hypothetical protein ACOYU2_06205 [Nitrospirota bacterium]|jgi:hypothetical protein